MTGLSRTVKLGLLVTLFAGLAGGLVPAYGQLEHSQSDASSQSSPQKNDAEQNKPEKAGQGFGAQLAHETREEAGEEKSDKAQFQESPSVQFVARLTGLSVQRAALLSTLLNFGVVIAIILWAGMKFLPGAFRGRTESIQKAMQEAQKASAEARRRLAEIESRLAKLDVEIGMMRDAAEHEAAQEEARIRAAAEEDARKIVESAEQEISAAGKAAQRALTAFAADLAVGLAQKQIHVDAGTDQALVRSFASELGTSGDAKDVR